MGKRYFLFILLLIVVFTFGFAIDAAEVKAQTEKISLDVRDADLRDVLSVLAIKTGTNIVLIEKPIMVTFSVENVSPMDALDLLLKSQGLNYIKNGNLLIVGKEGKLQEAGFATTTLTRFDLAYIKGRQLQPLINTLAIPVKSFTLETNPYAIWIQGTPENLIKVKELIKTVDNIENADLGEGETINFAFKELKTYAVEPTRLAELIKETGIPLKNHISIGNRLLVFDEKIIENWSQLQRVAMELDRLEGRNKTVFLYRLEHIVARDAASRMESFGYKDLELVTFNFPEYSKEVIVICPPELEPQVYMSLKAIDVYREKVKAAITSASGEYAKKELQAVRQLLSEMTPVVLNSMKISENLTGDPDNPRHILWAEETPDRIKMLQDLVESFKS